MTNRGTWHRVVALGIAIALGACAPATSQKTPVYTPEFDYVPPDAAQTASANVSFAIVQPHYAETEGEALGGPFEQFAESFAADFQEMLTERGYTVVGTFESYEQMTYPERKRADLALVPVLNFGPETTQLASDLNVKLLTESTYTLSGTDQLSGQITLAARETLTGERMWFKKIDLPTRNVQWTSATELTEAQANQLIRSGREDVSKVLMSRAGDRGVINPMAKELEAYYGNALETAWDFLNPQEMAHLKTLADSLKADYVPGR